MAMCVCEVCCGVSWLRLAVAVFVVVVAVAAAIIVADLSAGGRVREGWRGVWRSRKQLALNKISK